MDIMRTIQDDINLFRTDMTSRLDTLSAIDGRLNTVNERLDT